jgi:tight adherence protein B
MRYRLLSSLVVLAIAVALVPGANASAAPLSVSFGNEGSFPERTLLVASPATHPPTDHTLHVQENGKAVTDLSVTPVATARARDVGVILVIDTSESMAGAPVEQALIAARTLAAQRTGQQQFGVIEFNGSITQTLPLTSAPNTISAALAFTPRLGVGTHIYDATLEAIRQLHDANIVAGTVIVLSDGADVGSTVSQRAVASAAAANHIRVYTVGVKDRTFSARTLTSLARAAGGNYAASDAAGLRSVFTRIESQLTNRYVVRYRSAQGLGRRINVQAWIDGVSGVWVGAYSSPPPPPSARVSRSPSHVSARSFWTSTLAMVVVAFGSALLLVGGCLFHLVPRSRRHQLRDRVGEFTRGQPQEEHRAQRAHRMSLSERTDYWLGRFAWWSRFKLEMDVAAIERSPADLVLLTVAGTTLIGILVSLIVGTPFVSLPLLILAPVVMRGIVHARADRKRRTFADQLPGHLEEIGSAMRAGHSVAASIATVAQDAIDPTKREMERAVADERLGIPLDAALRPVSRRMKSTDLDQLALVATLNQRTGGNMAEVLDLIAAGARERADLRRELRALTAQARMSRWIVTMLPPAVLALLALIRPSYLRPLFHTTGGIIAMCVGVGLLVLGSFVMKMLVPSEV